MIKQFFNSKKFRITLHILFWICYLLLLSIQSGVAEGNYVSSFYFYCIYVIPITASTYFTNYFLIPKFLLKKKFKSFTLILFVSILFFVLLQRLNIMFVYAPLLLNETDILKIQSSGLFNVELFFSHFFSMYMIVTFFATIKLLKKWFEQQQYQQELIKGKLESEINFLKAQIHPHFLFNLLNNLYSLTLKKSDKAPQMILKLSSLLDFMLYQSNQEFVELKKEIDLIQDYIELEKLRYSENLNLEFSFNGDLSNLLIAPLILFPFIDNAFKHGVSNQIENSYIKINLKCTNQIIELNVENSKAITETKNSEPGIGLTNVTRRLELLYKNNFGLKIINNEKYFNVKLLLNTSNENN